MKKFLLTLFGLITALAMSAASDVLTKAFFGDPSGYAVYTKTSTETGVTYVGVCTSSGNNLQINNKSLTSGDYSGAYYGFYSNANPNDKVIKTIKVTYGSGSNTLVICGSNTPITASNDENATVITEISASSNYIDVSDKDYKYFCAYSKKGAIYLSSIDIEYVDVDDNRTTATLSYPETSYSVAFGEEFEAPSVVCDVEAAKAEIVYTSSNEEVAIVDATGNVTVKSIGTTEIKAQISGSDNYLNASASYLLTVYDPKEITLVFSDLGQANGSDLTNYKIGSVSFEFSKGTNSSNSPKAYDKSGTGRMYVNNTVTITVEQGYFLRSISFEDSSDVPQDFGTTAKATNGSIASGVWTAAGKYFRTTTITAGGTVKMDKVIVKVEPETEMDPEEYTNASFKNYILEADETIEFTFPEYAPEITLTSSDEDVIAVEGQVLKAVGPGEATITAAWEATEIWKAGSAEFTVNVTGLYDDPEFSVDVETIQVGSYSLVLVNEGDQLNIPITYVGGDDPEFTVTSSNEAVATATISADKKTVNVDVKKRGRAVLTLAVGQCGDFDAAELTINIQGCYHDLATILENAEVNEYYYGTFPITVALDNDMYNYVTDGTAWALMYVDHNHGDGAVIPAGWYAKYTLYNGLPEFTNIEHVDDEDITDNEPIEFRQYNDAEITVDMANEVLILNDVEFSEDTPSATTTNFYGVFGGIKYTFRNTLGKEGVEAGVYNVKAAIALYQAKNQAKPTIQIYPIDYIAQEVTTVPTPKFRQYKHGEAIEFEGLEEGAHILYRHGGEDPDHNNVFTEEAASAPRRAAALDTDWTYNHTTHPLTFQDGEEMTVKYMAKKAGKAPSEVQTMSIAGDGTTTGIENVAVETDEAVYYNLQGVRVANPESGVYVRVQGGKATKVVL